MAEHKDQKAEKGPRSTGEGVHELVPSAAVSEAFSVSSTDTLGQKVNELIGLLWLPPSLTEKEKNVRIVRAVQLFESLAPSDGAEAMLAMQMVGTHSAAMECLRRAMIPDQMPRARDSCLRDAQKMMTLYTRQLETLNRHRGKGQQKVTVEYVNVEAGGQAIVGSVDTGNRPPAKRRKKAAPNALEGSVTNLSDTRQLQRSR
jgi:hypothetical protein